MSMKFCGYGLAALIAVFSLSACGEGDSDTESESQNELSQQANHESGTASVNEEQAELNAEASAIGDLQERAKVLRQQVRDIVKMPQADDIKQCKLVGVGHRPCGGPESYTLYSTKNTDEEALLATVEEYNQLRKLLNEKEGMVSTCEVLPKPGLSLQGGVCMPVRSAEM